jgi:chromosome segregation ATPase
MLPTYYDMNSGRRHSLDNMRDDIYGLEESVETLIKRVDAINNQVDDDEQDLMGALKKIEDMQSDIAGHLTRLDDMRGEINELDVRGAVDELEAAHVRWTADADELEYRILLIEDRLKAPFDQTAYKAIKDDR